MSLALSALLLAGVACSSGEGSTVNEPPSSSPAASVEASPVASAMTFTTKTFTLNLKQDNDGSKFYFEPATIKAPEGATVTVQLKNVGTVEHNFSID
jgi:uncharacterized cupredoxin-like copper-binding protein